MNKRIGITIGGTRYLIGFLAKVNPIGGWVSDHNMA
jgi:hypothetical protein